MPMRPLGGSARQKRHISGRSRSSSVSAPKAWVWMWRGSIHSLRRLTVSPLPAPSTPFTRITTGKSALLQQLVLRVEQRAGAASAPRACNSALLELVADFGGFEHAGPPGSCGGPRGACPAGGGVTPRVWHPAPTRRCAGSRRRGPGGALRAPEAPGPRHAVEQRRERGRVRLGVGRAPAAGEGGERLRGAELRDQARGGGRVVGAARARPGARRACRGSARPCAT